MKDQLVIKSENGDSIKGSEYCTVTGPTILVLAIVEAGVKALGGDITGMHDAKTGEVLLRDTRMEF